MVFGKLKDTAYKVTLQFSTINVDGSFVLCSEVDFFKLYLFPFLSPCNEKVRYYLFP